MGFKDFVAAGPPAEYMRQSPFLTSMTFGVRSCRAYAKQIILLIGANVLLVQCSQDHFCRVRGIRRSYSFRWKEIFQYVLTNLIWSTRNYIDGKETNKMHSSLPSRMQQFPVALRHNNRYIPGNEQELWNVFFYPCFAFAHGDFGQKFLCNPWFPIMISTKTTITLVKNRENKFLCDPGQIY